MSGNEIDQELVQRIRASKQAIGVLEEVDLDSEGHVIDGHHRRLADPDWPAVKHENLKTEEDRVLFMIGKNWHRSSKSEAWKRQMIGRLAGLGNSVSNIVEKTGLQKSQVYHYLPDEFKDRAKAEAGALGGEATAEAYRESQEIAPTVGAESQDLIDARTILEAEEKARSAIRECYNCKMGFREDQMKYVDGKAYCPGCVANASIAFKKEQARLEKAKNKPVTPKSLDTPEEREARMQPHDSQFQIEVFTELAEEGLTFEQNQKLPVFLTEPDGIRYLNEERTEGLIVYLDNVETHKAKRMDADDRLRETYVKHNPGITKLEIRYKGRSEKEKARVKGLIREKYEFLKKWKTDIGKSEEDEDKEEL